MDPKALFQLPSHLFEADCPPELPSTAARSTSFAAGLPGNSDRLLLTNIDFDQTQDDFFTTGQESIAAVPLKYASSFSSVLGLTAQQQSGTRRTRAISTIWS